MANAIRSKFTEEHVEGRGVILRGFMTTNRLKKQMKKYQKEYGYDRIDIMLSKILDADAVVTNHECSRKWILDITHPKPEEFNANI